MIRNKQDITRKFPSLWYIPENPCIKNNVSCDQFYKKKAFIWIPMQHTGISCIRCKSKNLSIKEWPIPRRVIGLNDCYYVITRRLLCKQCKSTFSELDAEVPLVMADMIPATFTHRLGIANYLLILFIIIALDKDLIDMMRICFYQGMGPNPFRDMINEMHLLR